MAEDTQRPVIAVRQIEIHVAHLCNLHCDGCAHYSNVPTKGMLSLATARDWLGAWSARVYPKRFKLLGGEPTLNPELTEIVRLGAQVWPQAHRMLTTNGYFLHKHPDLPAVLRDTRTDLYVSIHSEEPAYVAKMQPVLKLLAEWANAGVNVVLDDAMKVWSRTYRGEGPGMRPYDDGNPRASWEACCSRYCMNLHQGRLWKCPPLAYLGFVADRFGLADVPAWEPYLDYRGIGPEASDDELREFFSREDEPQCGMCPAKPVVYSKSIDKVPRGA